jgi:hypothetical protein
MNTSKCTWLLVIFLLTIILQACATNPQYQTFYHYNPPKTTDGRACLFQCETTKMQCEQLDQMRADNCRERAELNFQRCSDRAQADYYRCKNSGEKYCSQKSCARGTCNSSGQCDTQYNRCYSICGGQVTSETRCVSNCDKK